MSFYNGYVCTGLFYIVCRRAKAHTQHGGYAVGQTICQIRRLSIYFISILLFFLKEVFPPLERLQVHGMGCLSSRKTKANYFVLQCDQSFFSFRFSQYGNKMTVMSSSLSFCIAASLVKYVSEDI